MKQYRYIILVAVTFLMGVSAMAQVDKKDVRRGNRDFRKENFREAEIDYRKALVKDSMSVAANYNLASTLYREGDYAQAMQTLERVKDVAPMSPASADYYFNLGDAALQQQDYQKAVEAFGESLIRRPDDLQAKENFIYAKKKLQDQQQNQQNQNNDQNQDNQDNQDQNDQNRNDDQNNQDQQNDQDKNDQNQDQNQDQNDQPQQSQGQQPKISPQAAQQMLQAIQAKEKETQDKVNKQKAEALKSRQKEKNW
ncbi:MAG: tetratricopeptide repeat protein [Bacteroidales bacterium]|nr:tetratricopeptide repeat protein [Bacteroidales bacterium]MBQ8808955.1 tetratricopeptide repeat protein [Bacteroidales bacterium]